MRLAPNLGRLFSCTGASLRLGPCPHAPRTVIRPPQLRPRNFSSYAHLRLRAQSWRSTRHGAPRTLLAAAGTGLTAAAFLELSEKGSNTAGETREKRMLEVSDAEIRQSASEEDTANLSLPQRLLLYLDLYVWEPLCTGFRFLQLVVIFVPVIITVPAIWTGRRIPERDNERSGALWWYGFLVRSMERAGPAFIKGGTCCDISPQEMLQCDLWANMTVCSLDNGQPRGPTSFPMNFATSCRNCTRMPLHTLSTRRSVSS
jgi:aarF domain-containing kinase